MGEDLILIFARNPEIGKCKTRLAEVIGNENALAIYKLLLKHTVDVSEKLNCDKAVYYSEKIIENDIWNSKYYKKFKQVGENLGIRMMHAFKNSLQAGYKKVIIIGSDIIDLKEHHINKAFKALDTNDVVIGPAEDGGYYLLGMKKLKSSIFYDKDWGTSTVRKDTLCDLSDQKVVLIEMLRDIDVFDDLKGNDIFEPYIKTIL